MQIASWIMFSASTRSEPPYPPTLFVSKRISKKMPNLKEEIQKISEVNSIK